MVRNSKNIKAQATNFFSILYYFLLTMSWCLKTEAIFWENLNITHIEKQ